ncbi:hypothetical protein TRAPUB_4943 [Trametes pubescens]|uniref:Uncharacterized protein n=1 Tax=Trametes pubescens TaxID=154538 RepID=A0A1M2V9S5_TRAPU|nr:hypothetical protein TRAPUB_4943 [Trametes pubescens]
MSHYMPFVPPDDIVDAAVSMLQNQGRLKRDGSGWHWPVLVGGNAEREAYGFLVDVSTTLCNLSVFPTSTHSQKPGADFKIDAIFALISPATPSAVPTNPTFTDMVVIA